jgi:hypothetical protein
VRGGTAPAANHLTWSLDVKPASALTSTILALSAVACASTPPAQSPAPTLRAPVTAAVTRSTAAISATDMRQMLYAYAADSMMGRETGTPGNVEATDYIAAQLERFGVEPADPNGSYFQTVPLFVRTLDTTTTLAVGTQALALWKDFAPLPNFGGFLPFGMRGSLEDVQVIYGGGLGDTTVSLTPEQVAGKLVVLGPPAGPNPQRAMGDAPRRYANAAGIAIAVLDFIPPGQMRFFRDPQETMDSTLPDGPLGLFITRNTLVTLLGAAPEAVTPGATGATVSGAFHFTITPARYPARNVIGIVRGSDPALRNEYVAIGAHNDHIGVADHAVDHDSIWAYNHVVRPMGAESPQRPATAEEQARIGTILDSLRALGHDHPDSVYNGADDDGSGTVTVLEIAEAFAHAPEKPRRSILFVWHTGEEKGLYGSDYFTRHPTVPRDSIVAQLNMDMVGRGSAQDIEGGGPAYLQLLGSRRLSTELGDLVETVNTRGNYGFTFDYQYDANGHPQQYYCRSDHYMYARYGIPIVFFSTGSHQDYHQLTDEPQYIDYDKMARIGRFVMDVAQTVANLDHRVVVDKPKPDPEGRCVQ